MPAANISMAVTDVSLLSDGSSMLVLSQILSSYSHELSCLLSGRGHSESDNLRDKLLTSLPHVADVCRHLVHSDSVSLCHPAVTQRNRLTLTWKMWKTWKVEENGVSEGILKELMRFWREIISHFFNLTGYWCHQASIIGRVSLFLESGGGWTKYEVTWVTRHKVKHCCSGCFGSRQKNQRVYCLQLMLVLWFCLSELIDTVGGRHGGKTGSYSTTVVISRHVRQIGVLLCQSGMVSQTTSACVHLLIHLFSLRT